MAQVSLKNMKKSYGAVDVIKGVDIEINNGEFVVFVGPSGCGKSTLLRMVAGLETITGGELRIAGELANHLSPKERGVAMVFQSYAIFPHMTVRENVAFGMKLNGVPKAERMARADEAARILQMEHLMDRKPSQLSGGQRQRVAIGRAIVRKPEVFLFDEPLSNLDASLRQAMRMEIGNLHKQLGATMIYVTHDQIEAMTLADKIVVLKDGLVQQIGSPMELFHHPQNTFVAGFIGAPSMNFLDVEVKEVRNGRAVVSSDTLAPVEVPLNVPSQRDKLVAGSSAKLAIRPQYLDQAATGRALLNGRIEVIERLGTETVINLKINPTDRVLMSISQDLAFDIGQDIGVSFDPEKAHLFAA
jgi:multiple sugar transport system ATP-binding protein